MTALKSCIPLAAYVIPFVVVLMFACEGQTTCIGADNEDSSLVWKCWAVIASAEIEETGLPDLVTLQLSETSELEFVERQQFDDVLTEQERSALFGNSGSGERLKIGQLFSADAIVFLELIKLPDGKE
jgi:hypothetical protein